MNNAAKEENNNDTSTISISSTYHDLSQLVSQDMLVYPGDPQPQFEPFVTIKKDKINVTRIVMGSHTGTHVDAPKHFFTDGNGIDSEPVDKFIGETIILDLSDVIGGKGITDSDLDNYSGVIKRNDILLLYTGTNDKWKKEKDSQINNFTYMDLSSAQWIVEHGIKCVGIDTLSVERYGFKEGLTHRKLLSNNIGIIENLNSNIKAFVGRRMFLVCLPLLLKGIDGSPARAILFDIVS
ncbi:MAG TPA: cyclase family protein [Nitrososphaeraceae archaeon]|jgi:arylformamidase|nr:cyclase family protein [Nitrososphaeraceae archaeon]